MAPVALVTLPNSFEADLLCGELQANGIECWAEKTEAGGAQALYGSNPQVGPTTVLVDESQLEKAQKLLPANQ